jgi:hypothetical protein
LLFIVAFTNPVQLESFVTKPTGGNNMKNKGGICCMLNVRNTKILVVACHLCASKKPDGMGKRNRDLNKIF